jgi:hypothetical protein
MNFKAKFKGYSLGGSELCWTVVSPGMPKNVDQTCIRPYSGQGQTWDAVTADTIKNCWNKVKIMPIPVVVAGGGTRDAVFDERATYWFQWARNVMSWHS